LDSLIIVSIQTFIINFVEYFKLISELFLCFHPNIFGTTNTILSFIHLILNLLQGWKFISLSLERITNSLNFVFNMRSFPINDDINGFRNSFFACFIQFIIEFLFKQIGFTLGRSEDKSLQSCDVFCINHTSNIANLNSVISDKSLLLSSSLFTWLSLELVLKLRNLSFTNS